MFLIFRGFSTIQNNEDCSQYKNSNSSIAHWVEQVAQMP